jgi:hypothetical protein
VYTRFDGTFDKHPRHYQHEISRHHEAFVIAAEAAGERYVHLVDTVAMGRIHPAFAVELARTLKALPRLPSHIALLTGTEKHHRVHSLIAELASGRRLRVFKDTDREAIANFLHQCTALGIGELRAFLEHTK